MPTTVLYKQAAEAEVSDVVQYYDSQAFGLGIEFLDELARIESHLRINPGLYQKVNGDIRRAVMRRFPYGVFYVVDGDRVFVLACFHLHRGPRSYMELGAR